MDLEPKKILKWYQKLPLEEKEKVFFQLEEIYHALHGELKSHYFKEHHYELIKDTRIKTGINYDPYLVTIEINNLPNHIRAFRRNLFNKDLHDFSRKYWYSVMTEAVWDLREKGVKTFQEKAVACYIFHTSRNIDCDNFDIQVINNTLRTAKIIKDDDSKHMAVFQETVIDGQNKLEIKLFGYRDFFRFFLPVSE